MYDIHTDHLDTPRVITDSSGTEVWRWDSAPFGETLPNEQPTNATSKFTFNIRFAGQYFDQETGLHYNYFRDYDPRTGRYVESDPIGLAGGMTTYGYVGANPVSGVDPLGLFGFADLPQFPWGLVRYAEGYKSYYGGLINAGSHLARRSGLWGECEQQRAIEEETVLGGGIGSMSIPQVAEQTWDFGKNWASENKPYIEGRASAGVVTGFVTRIGVYGGTSMAAMGDALEAIRNGADTPEAVIKGALGDIYDKVPKKARTLCECKK